METPQNPQEEPSPGAPSTTFREPRHVAGLQLGRVVHFVAEDLDHRPALITAIHTLDGWVNLVVFARSHQDSIRGAVGAAPGVAFAASVSYDETAEIPRSWHFPEHVP